MTQKTHNNAISPVKANHLYWMGRYAQRVYLAIHLLRKHYDLMIDQDKDAYCDFCHKIGIANNYVSPEDFTQSYLYDSNNSDAVITMLERLNDNAILLREEIKSETLSYIQLALNHMKDSYTQASGMCKLQNTTDLILAFWGSVDERILNSKVRKIIIFGKFVESMDLLIRFNYPLERITLLYQRMEECFSYDSELVNEDIFQFLRNQLTDEKYKENITLAYLNGVFKA